MMTQNQGDIQKPVPKHCGVCLYLMTCSREDDRGVVVSQDYYCNYGQARKLDRLVPTPDWCPNGGLPNIGGD